jgi:hypothetical protein
MGTFGVARTLVMFPASWGLYRHRTSVDAWLYNSLFDMARAQRIMATMLILYGTFVVLS